jgi:hypothetical protein
VYVSHHQVASRLLALPQGRESRVAGVAVERLPDGDGASPKASRFRVGGGEPAGLLVAIDALVRLMGCRPVPGGVPWRDDDGPAPSYGKSAGEG